MSAPVKLLFIIDSYKNPFAGTEGQLLKLLFGLDEKKFQTELVILRGDGFQKKNKFPVPYEILHIGGLSSLSSWLNLYRYFKSKKNQGFQLAHIFFNDASIICPPLLKVNGFKVLISRRDMGFWYTPILTKVLSSTSYFVDCVVVNSKAVKLITMKNEGYSDNRVKVIYNGYEAVADDAQTNSEQLNFFKSDGEFRIVLVANIRPIKRIFDAIYAMQLVVEDVPNAVLYILGDGDMLSLESLAESLNIADSICFVGARNDVLNLLPYFDIGILCSESEGFSNTIIEYLQTSLPVVCSRVGGNPEIISDTKNGFLYEVGDVRALAGRIIKLARDEALRIEMGSTGHMVVRSEYTLNRLVEQHRKLYLDVAKD